MPICPVPRCAARKPIQARAGYWHCPNCHGTYEKLPGSLACPFCLSEDVFPTDDDSWNFQEDLDTTEPPDDPEE